MASNVMVSEIAIDHLSAPVKNNIARGLVETMTTKNAREINLFFLEIKVAMELDRARSKADRLITELVESASTRRDARSR